MILAFIFIFIVYRIVSYIIERQFKPSGTGPNVLKSCVYINKAISSDRLYLRQIATAAFNLRTWDSDTRIGIISSTTESKRILCNLPVENQLFRYIHYCTEIPEINVNLLPNTCNFHRKFRRFRHLAQNAQNVHFREAKFQSFPGQYAPRPPSVLTPSMLDTSFAGLTLNCFRRACYYQWLILSILLCVLHTKMFLFSVEKGAPSGLYRDIYSKNC